MNIGAEHRDVFEQRGDFWAGVLEGRLDGVGREAIGEFLEDEMPALAGLVLDFDPEISPLPLFSPRYVHPSSVRVARIRGVVGAAARG